MCVVTLTATSLACSQALFEYMLHHEGQVVMVSEMQLHVWKHCSLYLAFVVCVCVCVCVVLSGTAAVVLGHGGCRLSGLVVEDAAGQVLLQVC